MSLYITPKNIGTWDYNITPLLYLKDEVLKHNTSHRSFNMSRIVTVCFEANNLSEFYKQMSTDRKSVV